MTEHNEQIYLKVKFKGVRREICQNPNALPLETGEPVIVEADRGEDLGFVLAPSHNPKLPENGEPPCPILRRATGQEVAKFHENRNREKLAQQFCLKKIQELNLPMNLIDVDVRLDRKKIIFYFTADDRIDFRELVKILAAEYKTRIEMRQVSTREEVKRANGVGLCGLPLCCSKFLDDFDPISTIFVKEQNLPMNPAKISGYCGKLKCCYRFEHELYEEFLRNYPPYGSKVLVGEKQGIIEKIDIFQKTITIRYNDNQAEDFPISEINKTIVPINN
jgi:cell fate regulator YaaT (PSP1 superfamily)